MRGEFQDDGWLSRSTATAMYAGYAVHCVTVAVAARRRAVPLPGGTALPATGAPLLAAGFALPVLIGATLGYFPLRSAPELVTFSVLALTGGALLTIVIEEMVPEAHDGETSALGAIFLTAGFALFGAVSTYVG
jgi:ZIP family zinc transporter